MFLWIFDLTDLVFHFNEDRLYVIPVLGSFLLTFYGFSHAKHLYIKHYSIHIKHMKQEKKLVLLSDIHLGTFVNIEQLKRIIEKVNQLHADIIVIAGDIFTKLAYGKRGYYGYYTDGTTQSVVSSGAGYFQMPMRVGSNSEIVVLHLSDEIKKQ